MRNRNILQKNYLIEPLNQNKMDENKPKLIISDYEWEDNIEYTYEIIGYNIYFSSVGFNTYDEAKKEGEQKLKEY